MDVVMPQLGETVKEGTVVAWRKKVGERVEKDESLFEVNTDKVDTEVPSPVTGVLRAILVAEPASALRKRSSGPPGTWRPDRAAMWSSSTLPAACMSMTS